jgi:hypothetical protein
MHPIASSSLSHYPHSGHDRSGPFALERHHRQVEVFVVESGHIVDSFVVTDPDVLRAAIDPIIRQMSAGEWLLYRAVEDASLPLGIGASRLERTLTEEREAERFLAA